MKAEEKLFNQIWIELTVEQREYLKKYIDKQKQTYARIQIEKDRERVKKSLRGLYDLVIDETPINLD